ncbi:MAG: hypothetical protein IJI87_01455, partial [Mogibacterium sp.]|nr:hypothetical protein [Mogibacterium sp.]
GFEGPTDSAVLSGQTKSCSEERHDCFDKRIGCADRATEHALNSRNNQYMKRTLHASSSC